ncbi:ATP-binding protein [Streptomyces sp. NPDC085932]|uniref:ATP-binding protein n=1 Tax=Streptomyces sp. NPDC085932 TaxID=3365741 RepID=UPI0037D35EEE
MDLGCCSLIVQCPGGQAPRPGRLASGRLLGSRASPVPSTNNGCFLVPTGIFALGYQAVTVCLQPNCGLSRRCPGSPLSPADLPPYRCPSRGLGNLPGVPPLPGAMGWGMRRFHVAAVVDTIARHPRSRTKGRMIKMSVYLPHPRTPCSIPAEAPSLGGQRARARAGPPQPVRHPYDHISWSLEFLPLAASAARRDVRRHLLDWKYDQDTVDTSLLLTTELVANAIEHGAAPLFLHLFHKEGDLIIAVHDGGGHIGNTAHGMLSDLAESGRGLQLVEALADAFCLTAGTYGTLAVARVRRPCGS